MLRPLTPTIAIALLLSSPLAWAGMWDLPAGTWRTKKQARPALELHLRAKRRFVIVIRDSARGTRRIAGHYRVRATKFNHQSATLSVQTLSTTVRGRAGPRTRKLAATQAFGLELRPAQALRFTLVGGCVAGSDSLQLCLHATKRGRPHVRCHTLYRPRRQACPPPLDGSRYNRPPSLAPRRR